MSLPATTTASDRFATLGILLTRLDEEPIEGKLWIVERRRIREYQPDN